MKNLWSSWRNEYITSFKDEDKNTETGCFLCDAVIAGFDNPQVVHIGTYAFVIMNKYPYNNGHLLISPKKHNGDLLKLTQDAYDEINALVRISVNALNKLYKPQGVNIGVNMGSAAGAGVPGHLHYHVLPRWEGDTNFMLTVADIKVVSEAMSEGAERLREFYKANSAE